MAQKIQGPGISSILELQKNYCRIMTNVNHRSDNKLRKLDQNQQKQGNFRTVL